MIATKIKMNYFALDTETTGLQDPYPIEIAAICIDDPSLKFSRRIHCIKPIDPRASLVHGIYNGDLQYEEDEATILKSFIKFLMFAIAKHNIQPPFQSITLIAHNYTYDKKVLEKALERHNLFIPIEIHWLCTMKLAKEKLVRKNGKATLESCCVEQDIAYNNGHRALNDAIMCAKLFKSFFKPSPEQMMLDEALQHINEHEEKKKNV